MVGSNKYLFSFKHKILKRVSPRREHFDLGCIDQLRSIGCQVHLCSVILHTHYARVSEPR